MTPQATQFTPAPIPDGIVEVNGHKYMADAKGRLTARELIKPQHLLQDELVRKVFGFAIALAEQLSRFKGHAYEDLGDFDAMLAQEYGLTKGGAKGNRTYTSFDGLMKIEVRVQDRIEFGPEMQIAKGLFDECLNEWSADTRAEMRSIVTNAFDTDKEGKINRTNMFLLLRTESEDARWQKGQDAIRDAIHIIGSQSYLRFQFRDAQDAAWQSLTIDLAKA
ncbi:DUF3164 family protein [Chachezhania antarctica]|uniref:DUF3164 family protein n=1 Tax=Chachezhania antarctica TaxID=2340860 RepID=UPI000EB17373|nr:DUF3164 family protein [Chachezhania antarctica]|tara:strand:- start:9850 stop:10512 length:663 start_codon:yes stop_codon:yes gene_type:complete